MRTLPKPLHQPSPSDDRLPIQRDEDVVWFRRAVRDCAVAAGLRLVDETKIVTAASEIARNALEHGAGGDGQVEVVHVGGRTGIRVYVEDHGPGIGDIQLALSDGYTSGSGMGLGLGGAKRLVDDFELDTAPGAGTRVTLVRWAT